MEKTHHSAASVAAMDTLEQCITEALHHDILKSCDANTCKVNQLLWTDGRVSTRDIIASVERYAALKNTLSLGNYTIRIYPNREDATLKVVNCVSGGDDPVKSMGRPFSEVIEKVQHLFSDGQWTMTTEEDWDDRYNIPTQFKTFKTSDVWDIIFNIVLTPQHSHINHEVCKTISLTHAPLEAGNILYVFSLQMLSTRMTKAPTSCITLKLHDLSIDSNEKS